MTAQEGWSVGPWTWCCVSVRVEGGGGLIAMSSHALKHAGGPHMPLNTLEVLTCP
ncbi:hypothetical protein JZ751_028418 [Albula glossodonta]|uniref:Uncharacterized protein n=1 Tax=Albula glossodonta TaxID=121402 RepID=A0A8T2MNI2_9TELE|nr:hypothetical protein JZ751_028418 [Albula glossodonta]